MALDVDLDVDDCDVGVDLTEAVCVRLLSCRVIPSNSLYSSEIFCAVT